MWSTKKNIYKDFGANCCLSKFCISLNLRHSFKFVSAVTRAHLCSVAGGGKGWEWKKRVKEKGED